MSLRDVSDDLTIRYVETHPEECAYFRPRWWQYVSYVLLVETVIVLALYDWVILASVISLAATLIYVGCISFRLCALLLSLSGRGELRITPEQVDSLNDDELPIYTILVPMYREANIAKTILGNIEQLDYPHDKLDVKVLLEEDDNETIEAVEATSLGDHFDVIVVAHSQPKTKPKACNHGLARARGEFVVIFDAEDRPEADQLKKAVYAFRNAVGPKTACIQGKLNYFNPDQNQLTRWFTIEYTMWFDLLLPGLRRMGAPIPLGGTSNHFRRDVLEELGGWDPFNVTEDCDLGVRISKLGYDTEIVNSTTWEEANSEVRNWINQRSRWMKGFFQTHISHMRHPISLLRGLGAWRTACFWLTVGGVSLTQVMNLVYWAVGGLYLALLVADAVAGHDLWTVIAGHRNEPRFAWKMIYSGGGEHPAWAMISQLFFAISCVLVLANLLFIATNCLACTRRGNQRLLGSALISPFYWVLISIGAWKGFLQLFTKRFYWEKTVHGLGPRRPESPPSLTTAAD